MLSSATVDVACIVCFSVDLTLSLIACRDELKSVTVADKVVAFDRAELTLEEVSSNLALTLSMRDAKWFVCAVDMLASFRASLASVITEITVELRSLKSENSVPVCD